MRFLVLGLVAVGCGVLPTRRATGVCCETEAECAAVDFDSPEPCAVGVCVNFGCVDVGTACDGDEDCRDASAPECTRGVCGIDCQRHGGRIAFVSDREGNDDVFVSHADGSFPFRVTETSTPEDGPVWSPDGREVAFARQSGPRDVFVADVSTRAERQISNDGKPEAEITWAPDGSKIAFETVEGTLLASTKIFTRDGGFLLATPNADGETKGPSWSPDSTRLVFRGGSPGSPELSILEMNGDTTIVLGGSHTIEFGPRWAPDGSRIAELTNRGGGLELHSILPTGTNDTPLTTTTDNEIEVSWSPGSDRLAVVRDVGGNREIVVINADGSGELVVAPGVGNDEHPRWSPDGQFVVFESDREGNRDIFRVRFDGTMLENLTENPADDHFPEWAACPAD